MVKKTKKASYFLCFKEPDYIQFLHLPGWMVFLLGIIFLVRVPSFFEPFYYGDEMIYLNLGQAIKRGMVLYRDIHDNKPPLLYFTAAIAGNVFWFRAILAAWMMTTTAFFYKLSNHLFPKYPAVVQAAVVAFAILTTIPLLEGQIANSELFMIGPVIYSFYILLSKKLTTKNLLFAGFLFSVGTLFKMPSMFDIGAIVFFWLIITKFSFKNYTNIFRNLFVIFVGFITPILVTLAWYASKGAFNEYLVAAFLQNIGYLSSFRPDDVAEPFLVKNGPLLLRGLIVLIGSFILYIFRKKLSKPFIFASLWLLFAAFAAFLSERPYPHYIIQVVPAISLMIGMLIAYPKLEQSLTVIPLSLVVGGMVYFQFWYYPSVSYYTNFAKFALGQQTKLEYFEGFSGNVNRNYKLAEYLIQSSSPNDNVFIWGDSPTVYALSNRLPHIKYVADYHIFDFSSPDFILKSVSDEMPLYVIVMPDSRPFRELNHFLQNNYLFIDEIDGANIWKRVPPSLSKLLFSS